MKPAFQLSNAWGHQPSEFWAMEIAAWWWIFDGKQAEAAKAAGKLPPSEWEKARNVHKEKMQKKRSVNE